MPFELIDLGGSRSLPSDDELRTEAVASAEVTLVIGSDAPARAHVLSTLPLSAKRVVLIELGTECLGFHIGEGSGIPPNVVGFARFRLGELRPSKLVELVRKPGTSTVALEAARMTLETAGLDVAICADVPGRIVDSLIRPYLNAALRSVDEGLAAPADLDQALRLGLGFPKGPIELLEASGVEAHFRISSDLHEALGAAEFAPARRARVQAMRESAALGGSAHDGN